MDVRGIDCAVWTGLEQGPIAGSFEHDNEFSSSKRGRELTNYLSYY